MSNPSQRVGGGKDSDSWWTGGSNIQAKKLKTPKIFIVRRPSGFLGAENVESGCKAGLEEENHLGLPDEKSKYTISLTEWVRYINKKLEDGGMDTVFRIYDATKSVTEKYLITHWGTIKEDEISDGLKT